MPDGDVARAVGLGRRAAAEGIAAFNSAVTIAFTLTRHFAVRDAAVYAGALRQLVACRMYEC